MNNATEQMLGPVLNPQQKLFAAKAALRNVWLAEPGDIVVSQLRVGRDFQDYVCRLLGLEPDSFAIVHPDSPGSDALSDEILLSDEIVGKLRSRIGNAGQWQLLACYQTEGTARLQTLLGLHDTVGRRFAEQRGTDLFNRKSRFRQLAAGAGMPLPDGAVVSTLDQLAEAIDFLIAATGHVIVKRDRGGGGTGNVIVSGEPVAPMPGACATIVRDDKTAEAVWAQLAGALSEPLVVETYHPAERMFYLEFHIGEDGKVRFLNSGTIRMRPHDDPAAGEMFWVGLELPADVPSSILAEATTHAARFLEIVVAAGYRGHINIDAIVTGSGALLFNEANARWGGGTVMDAVACRLLGSRFADVAVVSSFRDVPAPSLAATVAILHEHRLHYEPGQREGILVLSCDDQFTHTIEALLIAPTRAEIRALEDRLTGAMETKRGLAA